jgi:hypothetical protein
MQSVLRRGRRVHRDERDQGREKGEVGIEMAGGRSGGFILSGLELFKVVESFVEVQVQVAR